MKNSLDGFAYPENIRRQIDAFASVLAWVPNYVVLVGIIEAKTKDLKEAFADGDEFRIIGEAHSLAAVYREIGDRAYRDFRRRGAYCAQPAGGRNGKARA